MFNNLDKLKLQTAYFAIGRRKASVAKVALMPGNGLLTINQKPGTLYLECNLEYIGSCKAPLVALNLDNSYDIYVNAHGGGLRGQSDAIKLGVAKALCIRSNEMSNEDRSKLKTQGFLICDTRVKERKKYGLRKARKSPQYSKR